MKSNIGQLLKTDKLISDDESMASDLHSTFNSTSTKQDITSISVPRKNVQGL